MADQMPLRYFYQPGAAQYQTIQVGASPNIPSGSQEVTLEQAREYALKNPNLPISGLGMNYDRNMLFADTQPQSGRIASAGGLSYTTPETIEKALSMANDPNMINVGTATAPLYIPKNSAAAQLNTTELQQPSPLSVATPLTQEQRMSQIQEEINRLASTIAGVSSGAGVPLVPEFQKAFPSLSGGSIPTEGGVGTSVKTADEIAGIPSQTGITGGGGVSGGGTGTDSLANYESSVATSFSEYLEAYQEKQNSLWDKISGVISGNKPTETPEEIVNRIMPEVPERVKQLDLDLAKLKTDYETSNLTTENRLSPMTFIRGEQALVQRQYEISKEGLLLEREALMGDYDRASERASLILDIEREQQDQNTKNQEMAINFMLQSAEGEDQIMLQGLQYNLEQSQKVADRAYQDKKDTQNQIIDILAKNPISAAKYISKNGYPTSVAQALAIGKDADLQVIGSAEEGYSSFNPATGETKQITGGVGGGGTGGGVTPFEEMSPLDQLRYLQVQEKLGTTAGQIVNAQTGTAIKLTDAQSQFFSQGQHIASTAQEVIGLVNELGTNGLKGWVTEKGYLVPVVQNSLDPKAQQLMQKMFDMNNLFVYFSTGKQLNQSEFDRLGKQLPNFMATNEYNQSAIAQLTNSINDRMDNYMTLNGWEIKNQATEEQKSQANTFVDEAITYPSSGSTSNSSWLSNTWSSIWSFLGK